MRLIPATPQAIQEAAARLRAGELVVFPTETVYGLGAHALDAAAVAGIFDAKQRPHFNPLIVHVANASEAQELVAEIPPAALALMEAFWPGPLTLVLPRKPCVPDLVTGGLDTVAVRVPNHPVAQALLHQAAVPIAAPSANLFCRLSPTRAEHALEQLGNQVSLYLDDGPCAVGVESSIVGWVDGRATLLRAGGVTTEALEAIVGPLAPPPSSAPNRPLAPGGLARHYAPLTPLQLHEPSAEDLGRLRWGLLALSPRCTDPSGYAATAYLSEAEDLVEAATRLFAQLRYLEGLELDAIAALPVADRGLGLAINDRLRRAAAPTL